MRRARKALAAGCALAATLFPTGVAAGGGGCYNTGTEGTGDTVEMAKMCFTPSVLRVDPGTEVTFINRDPMPHNISAPGWGTDRDMMRRDIFTATFRDEGTFPYACMYHYGMTGTIVVGDGSGPASNVQVGSVRDLTDATPAASTTTVDRVSSRDSDYAGWAIAGGIGALLGAGTVSLLRRRRLEI